MKFFEKKLENAKAEEILDFFSFQLFEIREKYKKDIKTDEMEPYYVTMTKLADLRNDIEKMQKSGEEDQRIRTIAPKLNEILDEVQVLMGECFVLTGEVYEFFMKKEMAEQKPKKSDFVYSGIKLFEMIEDLSMLLYWRIKQIERGYWSRKSVTDEVIQKVLASSDFQVFSRKVLERREFCMSAEEAFEHFTALKARGNQLFKEGKRYSSATLLYSNVDEGIRRYLPNFAIGPGCHRGREAAKVEKFLIPMLKLQRDACNNGIRASLRTGNYPEALLIAKTFIEEVALVHFPGDTEFVSKTMLLKGMVLEAMARPGDAVLLYKKVYEYGNRFSKKAGDLAEKIRKTLCQRTDIDMAKFRKRNNLRKLIKLEKNPQKWLVKNGNVYLSIENLLLRILSSFERVEGRTAYYKFVSYDPNLKTVPKMSDPYVNNVSKADKTVQIELIQKYELQQGGEILRKGYIEDLLRSGEIHKSPPYIELKRMNVDGSDSIKTFFPEGVKLSKKLKQEIFCASKFRFSGRFITYTLYSSVEKFLKPMGVKGFFIRTPEGKKTLPFDGIPLHGFTFTPERCTIFKLRTDFWHDGKNVTERLRELKKKLGTSLVGTHFGDDFVIYQNGETVHQPFSKCGHSFIRCGEYAIDYTGLQFGKRGSDNQRVIIRKLDEYMGLWPSFSDTSLPGDKLDCMQEWNPDMANDHLHLECLKMTIDNFSNKACAWCGNADAAPKKWKCGICRKRFYCDSYCQKCDWKRHKKYCQKK